ncbi:hypothetical protein [Moorena sp. SIO3H5]
MLPLFSWYGHESTPCNGQWSMVSCNR